ncbi:doublecortin domain-containing protein 2-like isoform X2 [Macrobrachium nipponense]|uniref:doublecortin domain-containing protein 2-like isoform X2 n=1 Tax=Macrobrachium nipponense TaxID=159736 RepID=UPI0030C88A15
MYRNYQLPEGKRIKVYKSGDTFYTGKSMVVNPMQIKNLDNLITSITDKVDPDWGAVRSIHTPNTGTLVQSIDAINREGVYVAAGPKGFVSIPGGYENIGKPGIRKKFANHKPIHRSGLKNEVYSIQVFKNGEGGAPIPFKFTQSDISNWDQALYRLSEKVRLPNGPVKRMYHMNGKIVRSPSDLENNGTYVVAASNETFRTASYGDAAPPDDTQHPGDSRGPESRFTKKQQQQQQQQQQPPQPSRGAPEAGKKKQMKLPTKKLTRRPKTEPTEEEGEPRKFSSSDSKKLGPGRAKANVKRTVKTGEGGSPSDTSQADESAKGRKFSKGKPHKVVSSKLQSRSKPTGKRNNSANGQSRGPSTQPKGTPATRSTDGGDKNKSRFSKARTNRSRVASPVTAKIPKEIPESSDPGKVEYLKLASTQNSPYQSPGGTPNQTPANSRPSSPHKGYDHRSASSPYSPPEVIAEEYEDEEGEYEDEDEDDLSAVTSVGGRYSRMSVYDSGHASLFGDEDRPDSVFRAKTRSRPVTMVDYDTDDGGIFRAKSKSDYVRGAKEILESSATAIELPIDLLDAKEVQEEILVA